MGVMEGRSRGEIAQKYQDLLLPALYTNWKVWPGIQARALYSSRCSMLSEALVQFINFKFIPLQFRVPFQSTCGCFWTLYLSLLNASYVHLNPSTVLAVAHAHPSVIASSTPSTMCDDDESRRTS